MGGRTKTISSMFVGTSPELEFALYTLCFKLRTNRKCNLSYENVKFTINTFTFNHNNQKFVATAFVENYEIIE